MENRLIVLSKYRFETAEDDLETARILFEAGTSAALNRSYYAIFMLCVPLLRLMNLTRRNIRPS